MSHSREMLHNQPTLNLGIKAVSCQCLVKGNNPPSNRSVLIYANMRETSMSTVSRCIYSIRSTLSASFWCNKQVELMIQTFAVPDMSQPDRDILSTPSPGRATWLSVDGPSVTLSKLMRKG